MRQHIPGTLRTFTIGYPDKSFSELDYAETVSKHLGTEHHVLMIEGLNEELIEKSLYHFDEPMTDLIFYPADARLWSGPQKHYGLSQW